MAQKVIINTRCPFCGDQVDMIPDSILRKNPHEDNVEYVVTRTGYKRYFHTNCWYRMIEEQKEVK